MRTIFVLGVIAVWLMFAIKSSFAALLFYWWLAIFRPQDWVFADISFLHISLVSGVILVLSCFLSGKWPRIKGVLPTLATSIILVELLAYGLKGCGVQSDLWMGHLGKLLLVLLLSERLIEDSPRRWTQLVAVVGLSLGFFASKAGFFAILDGGSAQINAKNLGGSFSGSNSFALGTAVIVFYLIIVAENLRLVVPQWSLKYFTPTQRDRLMRWGKYFIFMLIAFSIYNIFSLHSRGNSLAVGIGLLIYIWLQKNGAKTLLKLAPIGLIALLLVPLPEGFQERIASVFVSSEELDNSAASRPYFWKLAYRMAADSPLGIGPGCYIRYYNEYDETQGQYGPNRSVHSAHAQILAETGFLGFFFWTVAIFYSMFACRRVWRRSAIYVDEDEDALFAHKAAKAMACSVLTFAIGSTFYETAHVELIWLNFILVSSLTAYWKKCEIRLERAAGQERRDRNAARDLPNKYA